MFVSGSFYFMILVADFYLEGRRKGVVKRKLQILNGDIKFYWEAKLLEK